LDLPELKMKTVTVVYEGVCGRSIADLDDRTPLEAARCHHAARIAARGRCGVIEPMSEKRAWPQAALLGALSGIALDRSLELRRGPVEAVTVEDDLRSSISVFRGDFVTLDEGVIESSRVAGLRWEETRELAAALNQGDDTESVRVAATGPGTVAVGFPVAHVHDLDPEPPYEVRGRVARERWPSGKSGQHVRSFLQRAAVVLGQHPVNEVRLDLHENPANGLWLWAGGAPVRLGSLAPRAAPYGIVTNSQLGRGIAALCGATAVGLSIPWSAEEEDPVWSLPELVELLRGSETLMVYLEAPQEGGQYGSPVEKVRALDVLDQVVLGPLVQVLDDGFRPYRISLIAEGGACAETSRRFAAPLPAVVAGDGIMPDETERWEEGACAKGDLGSMKLGSFAGNLWSDSWP
jgi:2,3-bisphosphoglycerate-independent phosphoglycerate mutase